MYSPVLIKEQTSLAGLGSIFTANPICTMVFQDPGATNSQQMAVQSVISQSAQGCRFASASWQGDAPSHAALHTIEAKDQSTQLDTCTGQQSA